MIGLDQIKQRIRHILRLGGSPHELAKSFAVGVFVAFTPFIGLHTVMALTLAWALRLNKAVALTGTFVNNPWTIIFVYVAPTWGTVMAMRSMGIDVPVLNYEMLSAQFAETLTQYKLWEIAFWRSILSEFQPYVHAFLVGTTIAGVAAAFASYFIAYSWITIYRKEKARLHSMSRTRHD